MLRSPPSSRHFRQLGIATPALDVLAGRPDHRAVGEVNEAVHVEIPLGRIVVHLRSAFLVPGHPARQVSLSYERLWEQTSQSGLHDSWEGLTTATELTRLLFGGGSVGSVTVVTATNGLTTKCSLLRRPPLGFGPSDSAGRIQPRSSRRSSTSSRSAGLLGKLAWCALCASRFVKVVLSVIHLPEQACFVE